MDKKGRLSLKLKQRTQHCQSACGGENYCRDDESKSVTSTCTQPCSGLTNLGNTCYCNAVLQALRHCPGFSLELKRMSQSFPLFRQSGENEFMYQLSQVRMPLATFCIPFSVCVTCSWSKRWKTVPVLSLQ